jgi:hypothetical protein
MTEWKDVKTPEDIPKPGTWDQYEWGEKWADSSEWREPIKTPDRILVFPTGTIVSWSLKVLSYRPKSHPSDEYIKAHLWETNHGTWANAKDIQLYHGSRWFFTARHIPKSAIKTEVSE